MILIRCSRVTARLLETARALQSASKQNVRLALDDRAAVPKGLEFETLTFSRAAVRGLGLYAPKDFRWRCGDYLYYLAAATYPGEDVIWLIESDVIVNHPGQFFGLASRSGCDFIAADLRMAESAWYWYSYALGRGIKPYRCLFPVTRLSRRAICSLLERRQRHSRNLARRILWANDEGFVATSLAASSLLYSDINSVCPSAWESETFSYDRPISTDRLSDRVGKTFLLHPVLEPSAYERKMTMLTRNKGHAWPTRLLRRFVRPICSYLEW